MKVLLYHRYTNDYNGEMKTGNSLSFLVRSLIGDFSSVIINKIKFNISYHGDEFKNWKIPSVNYCQWKEEEIMNVKNRSFCHSNDTKYSLVTSTHQKNDSSF